MCPHRPDTESRTKNQCLNNKKALFAGKSPAPGDSCGHQTRSTATQKKLQLSSTSAGCAMDNSNIPSSWMLRLPQGAQGDRTVGCSSCSRAFSSLLKRCAPLSRPAQLPLRSHALPGAPTSCMARCCQAACTTK